MSHTDLNHLHAEWAGLVAEYRASGQTQRQWAAVHGVTLSQLRYWVHRFPDPVAPTAGPAWVTVSPAVMAPAGVTVHVGVAEVRVAPGFDPQLLQAVVRALATC
jgi:hypothetical protein